MEKILKDFSETLPGSNQGGSSGPEGFPTPSFASTDMDQMLNNFSKDPNFQKFASQYASTSGQASKGAAPPPSAAETSTTTTTSAGARPAEPQSDDAFSRQMEAVTKVLFQGGKKPSGAAGEGRPKRGPSDETIDYTSPRFITPQLKKIKQRLGADEDEEPASSAQEDPNAFFNQPPTESELPRLDYTALFQSIKQAMEEPSQETARASTSSSSTKVEDLPIPDISPTADASEKRQKTLETIIQTTFDASLGGLDKLMPVAYKEVINPDRVCFPQHFSPLYL